MKLTKQFVALFAALAAVSCSPTHNTLTVEEKADGWQLLFDGETMNGWRDFNGNSLTIPWVAIDGVIRASGTGDGDSGYIVTDKEYDNFILDWDWKLPQGGNSGMYYHVLEGAAFQIPYLSGPEYQLKDHTVSKLPGDWRKLGSDYGMYGPDTTKMNPNPCGEWNNSRIVFNNGHVEHWLNGEKIVEFEAWTPDWFARKKSGRWASTSEYGVAKRGLISLQDNGFPVEFRNIKIKELPKKVSETEEILFNGVDLTGWEAFGTELWYVEDSLLVCESGPEKKYGYLATDKYYDNYDLSVEFKQLANGNSGVFIRSFIEPEAKVNGWQVEVAPKGNDTGGIYESYGRGWLIQIEEEKENILKEGEWNTLRIKVDGDNVTTWLNGTEMVNLTDEKIGKGKGRIALQIHDGGGIKVQWKNLKLKNL